jgi:metal-responsive CopG/Arc/MetJ family transcriptional regulator
MGRKRINEDHTPARLPAGTLDRIEAVLREREKRSDFIRTAIERELKRREGSEVANRTMVQPRKNQKPRKK